MLHQEVRDGLPVLLCRRSYLHCARALPGASSPGKLLRTAEHGRELLVRERVAVVDRQEAQAVVAWERLGVVVEPGKNLLGYAV